MTKHFECWPYQTANWKKRKMKERKKHSDIKNNTKKAASRDRETRKKAFKIQRFQD